MLNSVASKIDARDLHGALSQLQNDLITKTDGYAGGRIENDWIIDQDASLFVYKRLLNIILMIQDLVGG